MSFIPFDFPGIPGVRCVFQTREGGLSQGPYRDGNISYTVGDEPLTVSGNRIRLASRLGLKHFAELQQVHGDTFLFEPEPAPLGCTAVPPVFPEGDGFATTTPGLGLLIKTADCQPLLIAHRDGRHVAALHVGWRGNRIGFIESAIQRFCDHYQLQPADLMAVRGPSLGPAHAEFVNFTSEWGQDFSRWYSERDKTMNLWALTFDQLRAAGLPEANLFGINVCTYTSEESFFSFRRERVCGRQASLIWIDPAFC